MTGESKTGAIRTALRERKARLDFARPAGDRDAALRSWLEEAVWSRLPADARGHAPTPAEQDALLGFTEQRP